ncbi:MAG: thioredoxin family protein [Cytophagales bacterium]|nr:MAG: thioredoxin family protein [Cytophagales bacterium]TAF59233.1 MAG: thioredoxin family protein [Cytophagales bacterium]
MKTKHICLAVLLLFVGIASLSMMRLQDTAANPIKSTTINWTDIETAMKLSQKDGKPIFVDVYTEWCGWCKVMDKNTFSNADVVKYVNANYHAVKLDAEKSTLLTFNGENMTNAQLTKNVFKVRGYPTIVFIKGSNIKVAPGYQEPQAFLNLLNETAK